MSVSRIVTAVSYALARKMDQFITFPTGERARKVMHKFGEKGGIRGIVGAIDCTHVQIVKPKGNQLFYINRKGYHSMNIQAVCNADRCFTSVLAKFPGSAHDSRIFSQSALCADFEAGRKTGILLGDAGYDCKSYLLTPYDNARSRIEGRFNKRHARQRVLIEQAFGCLKSRFHILHGEIRLPSPTKVCAIVVACCVLHNMAIRRNLPNFYNVIDDHQPPEEAARPDQGHGGRSGPVIRDEIARLLMLA
uniref:Putative nuclease HARBI1 n=1 Tax=Plectus sambesii TaxID=2011161 RepID=A0A914VBA8_9BILA